MLALGGVQWMPENERSLPVLDSDDSREELDSRGVWEQSLTAEEFESGA